jgi:protein-tyrosine phosphatase
VSPYWIEADGIRLAIIARPRGWDWLADDIANLRRDGFNAVVSLLTAPEAEELGLLKEGDCCKVSAMQFISLPIEDRSVPASMAEYESSLRAIEPLLIQGKAVGVHCRAGIGRSALLAASILIRRGVPAQTAFSRIAEARGCPVPDTAEQRQWVEAHISKLKP